MGCQTTPKGVEDTLKIFNMISSLETSL